MFYLHICGIHPTVKTVGFLPKNAVNHFLRSCKMSEKSDIFSFVSYIYRKNKNFGIYKKQNVPHGTI